jgi:hypothetical protein
MPQTFGTQRYLQCHILKQVSLQASACCNAACLSELDFYNHKNIKVGVQIIIK